MSNEMIENINKMGKSSYDSMKELYEINLKVYSQLAEQQVAFANLLIDSTTTQMKMLSKAKGYKDIVSGQSQILSEMTEKAQGIARNTMDIVNESKDEVSAWVEKGVKEVSAVVPVAPFTAKKTA